MFDVGFWEILIILILALVVIGPERLPGAARKAGYFVGKARRYIEGVRSEVESELDVNEFKRMLHNQEVQINELQEQIKSGVNDVKSGVSDVTSAAAIDDSELYSFHDEMPEDVDAPADASAKTDSSSNKENS